MPNTEEQVHRFISNVFAMEYHIGTQHQDGGVMKMAAVGRDNVHKHIKYLKAQNAHGYNVYVRPVKSLRWLMLDDVTRFGLMLMHVHYNGRWFAVETSPGNYQVWMDHGDCGHNLEESKEILKVIGGAVGADLHGSQPYQFGRWPGFTNRKLKHLDRDGHYPWVTIQ